MCFLPICGIDESHWLCRDYQWGSPQTNPLWQINTTESEKKILYKTTKRPQLIILTETLVFQINCSDIPYLHISLMVSLSHVKQCIILLKTCHTFQRLLLRFRDKVYYVMSVVWFGACVIWSCGLWLEPGGGNRHHQRNTMLMMKNLNFWPGFLRPFHKALNSIKYQSKKF